MWITTYDRGVTSPRLLIAAGLAAGLLLVSSCGSDDGASCAEVERLANVYIDSPTMTEADYFASIGADSEASAEEILEGCRS